jgi:hypothetical protein
MTDREAMQQALEALEEIADEVFSPYDSKLGEVILALRERLAQPETVMAEYKFQTYAAYKTPDGEMKIGVVPAMKEGKDFTISKPWVGLTEEEISEVLGSDIHLEQSGELRFIRAIEAKLKEKNA